MNRPRIFISHSTDESDQAGRARVHKLRETLVAAGFDAVVDLVDINAGDRWMTKLFEWILSAHGAVVLLSKLALKSDFVKVEAAIFSFLACRRQDFRLIPVLVDEVTWATVDSGFWKYLQLDALQAAKGDDATVAARVVEGLAQLRQCRAKSRRENLVERIAGLLERQGIDPTHIAQLYAEEPNLRQTTARYGPFEMGDTEPLVELAHDLLASPIDVAYQALGRLAQWRLQPRELVEFLAPGWLTEIECRPVAERALSARFEDRGMRLVAEKPWTAKCMIGRAFCHGMEEKLGTKVVTIGAPQECRTLDELERKLSAALLDPDDEPLLADVLNGLEEDRWAVFVVFSGWEPDESLVRALRHKYRTLNLFVLEGSTASPGAGRRTPGLEPLHPVLPDRERQAYLTYTKERLKWR